MQKLFDDIQGYLYFSPKFRRYGSQINDMTQFGLQCVETFAKSLAIQWVKEGWDKAPGREGWIADSLTAGTSRTRVFRRAPRGWFSALLMIDHPRSTGERPLHAHPQLSVICRVETVVDSGCSLRKGWGLTGDLFEGAEGAHLPSRTLYSPQP